MRTISHREFRNNSSEILRNVASGEIIEVTNHGEVVAVLVPPSSTSFERLVAAGKVLRPETGPEGRSVDLRQVPRVQAPVTTSDIISDVRGNR